MKDRIWEGFGDGEITIRNTLTLLVEIFYLEVPYFPRFQLTRSLFSSPTPYHRIFLYIFSIFDTIASGILYDKRK